MIFAGILMPRTASAFEYSVHLPESLRQDRVGKAEVRLMVPADDSAIIVGVTAPKDSEHLTFVPGGVTVAVSEDDTRIRWVYTFEVKALSPGEITPDPFIVQYYDSVPSEPEAKPAEKSLDMPRIRILPPIFILRRGFFWTLSDLFIILVFGAGIYYIIRKRRKAS